MSKKKNEIDDMGLVPELFDGKHQVIPIISGGDDSIEDVSLPEVLPILTLRSSVIFPGSVTPITVGRAKSIALVRAVEAGDRSPPKPHQSAPKHKRWLRRYGIKRRI